VSVIISCFEISRDLPSPVDPAPGRQVHRALAPDARFGYISLDSLDAGRLEPEVAARALTGRYDVIHTGTSAAPSAAAPADEERLIFVNCMAFDVGREEEAFEFWLRVNEYMVRKPGYRWHRLHRRVDDDAPFGQINVVEWESVAAWEAAHDDGFRALTVRPDIPFTAVPTLCRAVPAAVEA
jgi:hypothetical protein